MSRPRRTLQEEFDELAKNWAELRGLVLAQVARHFWLLLGVCVGMVALLILIVAAFGFDVLGGEINPRYTKQG